MRHMRSNLPGIILCLAIAVPAWFLGGIFPVIGGPVWGILFGMVIAALYAPPPRCSGGIKYTSKKLLQYAIILLGFEMNLYNLIKVGGQSLLVLFFTLAAAFLTAWGAGKLLKLPGKTTTLIGVGTSICGGSAIAAAAPVIRAEDEDVSRAISTIFLFNVLAVFIFPALGRLLGMSDAGFGMWAGTAINDTSSVVAAGVAWSNLAGSNSALAFATIVKLTRTLMIVPVTLVLAVYMAQKNKAASASGAFNFSKVFPWFVLGFVLAALINTFAGLPPALPPVLVQTGKFVIVMAMTAIGLNTNLKKLLLNGSKPILLGLCCWFAVAAVSLLVQLFMKTW